MVNTNYAQTDVLTGAEVFGSDGAKVGTVATVYPGYVVVEKGFFFPTDYYIPRSAIASFDGERVYLTVGKDDALHRGWDVIPVDLETSTASSMATDADRLAATRMDTTAEELRIPLVEEELTATVRPQQAGAVRIEKDVIAEEQTLEVPVTEERVRIERRVVDRPATAADAEVLEDTVIEVPLSRETVDVQKQARVREEIVVSKEAVQRTERVSDTVRREEAIVDDEGIETVPLVDEHAQGAPPAV